MVVYLTDWIKYLCKIINIISVPNFSVLVFYARRPLPDRTNALSRMHMLQNVACKYVDTSASRGVQKSAWDERANVCPCIV